MVDELERVLRGLEWRRSLPGRQERALDRRLRGCEDLVGGRHTCASKVMHPLAPFLATHKDALEQLLNKPDAD